MASLPVPGRPDRPGNLGLATVFSLSGALASGDVWVPSSRLHRSLEVLRSGTSDARPRLKACLEYVREGDVLAVTRLDRLARSTLHLCQIAQALKDKGADLKVLDQNIDTGDATGRLLFNMLGAIGQFETEIRAERQMDGIQKARERGVEFGRKRKLTAQMVNRMRDQRNTGALIRDLMHEYGLSKATVYRYLDEKAARSF